MCAFNQLVDFFKLTIVVFNGDLEGAIISQSKGESVIIIHQIDFKWLLSLDDIVTTDKYRYCENIAADIEKRINDIDIKVDCTL